jgi:NADPH2:quinone reductase
LRYSNNFVKMGAVESPEMAEHLQPGEKMPTHLPPAMRALELQTYGDWRTNLKLVEKPIPRPGPNQVLVRMAAAPVHPADLGFLRGRYGVRRELPTVPGWEGSGTVVATGGGLTSRFLLGRRVACAATNRNDGTWAEYMLTSPTRCFPLRSHITDEQGATMIVNPLTAWALMNQARRNGHRAAVQTAAASALGRMLLRLGQRFEMPMVHVVRRQEQVDLLHSLGAEHVLSTHEPDFDNQLRELCRQLNVTQAFDAVAGEMTGQLLGAMPPGAQVTVYGTLSGSACQANPRSFIFKKQRVDGFWIVNWSPRFGLPGLLYTGWQVQKLLDNELKTEVQARLPLEEVSRGLEMYQQGMTKGKILFLPGLRPDD